MAAKKSETFEVVLNVPTYKHKAGETIQVADAETAAALVKSGQARPVSDEASDKDA